MRGLLYFIGLIVFSHFSLAETLSNQNQNVWQLRQEITAKQNSAQQTLRQNCEGIIRSELDRWAKSVFMKNWKFNATVLNSVQQQLDQMSDVTLVSGKESKNPSPNSKSSTSSGRLAIGWNLRNNFSKIEYSDESFTVGLYHPRTLNALRGSETFTEGLALNINKRWEGEKTTASFQMPWSLPYYSASLTREFSTSLSTTFSTQAPLRGTQLARKIEVKISLIF